MRCWYISHMPIAKKPLLNAHANVSKRAEGLHVSVSLSLLPYFMYTSNGGSDETAHMRSLARAFTAHRCD